MSVYAISDLHLPLGINKPMNIFGREWDDYVERIFENWNKTINENDAVLICGDISWATYLQQAKADFDYLNKLPGIKIISKGNHDYWWSTMAKLENFLEENGCKNFVFLHNNAYLYENIAICAARGWKSPFDKDFNKEDEKIYERELLRLRLSLTEGKKLSDEIVAMVHYPPDFAVSELLDEFGVRICVYGHLHGRYAWERSSDNPRYILVSADYLEFIPRKIL